MKFKINREYLLDALNKVSRAINAKTPLIALTGIKFTLTNKELELVASGSDISIKSIIPVETNDKTIIEVEDQGSIVINGKLICEIVSKFESELIEIDVVDNLAKIKSDKAIFSVNSIPAIDYPEISFNDNYDCSFNIDALELKNLFDQTLFATSEKEARPVLTGLNFKCENGELEVVATDTFRLSKKTITLNNQDEFNITIPKSALDDINKIIELGRNVKVSISNSKVSFDDDSCVIVARVINGTFPKTSSLIPNQFSQVLTISTKELVGAVERVSILLTEKNNVVKLNLKQEEAFVSSKSVELGYAVEKLNDYGYEGEEFSISFSARYLLDAIRALDSEEISLNFSGDMKPIILKSKSNSSLIELILPVRTYN